MISFLRGTVAAVQGSTVVLDVGGLGLEIQVTSTAAASARVGELQQIPAVLVVREDAWTAYGFADADERAVFAVLQSVKGIGPRIALSLLSTLTTDELRRAVHSGDARTLVRVPGIGLKGAQRMVLDLRDRLGPATGPPASGAARAGAATVPGAAAAAWERQVADALVGLGWSAADAGSAVAAVADQAAPGGSAVTATGTPDISALLRLALRSLDRGGHP